MSELFEKKCVPCEGGIPALDIGEIHKYQKPLLHPRKEHIFYLANHS